MKTCCLKHLSAIPSTPTYLCLPVCRYSNHLLQFQLKPCLYSTHGLYTFTNLLEHIIKYSAISSKQPIFSSCLGLLRADIKNTQEVKKNAFNWTRQDKCAFCLVQLKSILFLPLECFWSFFQNAGCQFGFKFCIYFLRHRTVSGFSCLRNVYNVTCTSIYSRAFV